MAIAAKSALRVAIENSMLSSPSHGVSQTLAQKCQWWSGKNGALETAIRFTRPEYLLAKAMALIPPRSCATR